jgi:hypothetical protein
MTRRRRARVPDRTMDAIAARDRGRETRHRGEVCFVVEAELTTAQLWRGLARASARARVFACRRVEHRGETTAC